jgi:hypothetical protein
MYGLLGAASAVVTVLGVRRFRPPTAWPWYALAAGRLAWATGDVLYWWQTVVWNRDVFPSVADVFYLAHYALLVAGLVGLVRARRPGKDRPGLLDALVLSTGAAMLAWVFSWRPTSTTANCRRWAGWCRWPTPPATSSCSACCCA